MSAACYECGRAFKRNSNDIRCSDCRPIYWRVMERAHSLVGHAIRCGALPRLSDGGVMCVDCGSQADRYDHRDYTKPLEVEPVCRACNRKRGPAARVIGEAA